MNGTPLLVSGGSTSSDPLSEVVGLRCKASLAMVLLILLLPTLLPKLASLKSPGITGIL